MLWLSRISFAPIMCLSLSLFAADTPAPTQDVDADAIIEAVLMKKAAEIIAENIKASERESGDIDKLIRAMSGVSVKDIEQYGICGGPNSEVRKLAGDLCK